MKPDNRCPVEVPISPAWRCHVDQRVERPGEIAVRGYAAEYRGQGFGVVVTGLLAKGVEPKGALIRALEEALGKARSQ